MENRSILASGKQGNPAVIEKGRRGMRGGKKETQPLHLLK